MNNRNAADARVDLTAENDQNVAAVLNLIDRPKLARIAEMLCTDDDDEALYVLAKLLGSDGKNGERLIRRLVLLGVSRVLYGVDP